MLTFKKTSKRIIVQYTEEYGTNQWIWNEIKNHNYVKISRAFHFKLDDLLVKPHDVDHEDFENFIYEFLFAIKDGEYYRIRGRIFNIERDVLIGEDIEVVRKTFVAERNILIPRKISRLIEGNGDLVIGGSNPDSIPADIYADLLKKFPTTVELNRYSDARVEMIVGEHVENMRSAKSEYEKYLNKKPILKGDRLDQNELLNVEIQKFTYVRDVIASWLSDGKDYSERDWQTVILKFILLIFPKYIAVLENVELEDSYSNERKKTKRFIDMALIDVNGNIDVIEIKKPFGDCLLSKSKYRDNYIPRRELAGSIMQSEKYIFHLSKWGVDGENRLTAKYGPGLPSGMKIRITNPKAMIILGRDQAAAGGGSRFDRAQLLDLEIIKRKYANMIDIMTYDDVLRRLDNIITSLKKEADVSGMSSKQELIGSHHLEGND